MNILLRFKVNANPNNSSDTLIKYRDNFIKFVRQIGNTYDYTLLSFGEEKDMVDMIRNDLLEQGHFGLGGK